MLQRQLVSVISVQHKKANRTAYAAAKAQRLKVFVSTKLSELTSTLCLTFSFDKLSFHHFRDVFFPMMLSGCSYAAGELVTKHLSTTMTETDEFDFIFKLMISSALLSYSATQRVTEKKIKTTPLFSVAAASELLAIAYLYSSSLKGCRKLLEFQMNNRYSLLSSLMASFLVIPTGFAFMVEKYQKMYLKAQHQSGAQRSDTTLISSGMTPVGNAFFQVNRLLLTEILSVSRVFQLGLISSNILHDKGITRQLRNVPAMFIDMVPQILRKLFMQAKKIEEDYQKNSAVHVVLRNSKKIELKRHELRLGDLVWCGSDFDCHSVPISGEVFASDFDEATGRFSFPAATPTEFRVNLKTYTGENIWLKSLATNTLDLPQTAIDQHAIQEGRQLGILDGAQIDFLGQYQKFFIRVAKKKEIILDSSFDKKSTINQIISTYKEKSIIIAVALSALVGAAQANHFYDLPFKSMHLLFSLFQMICPFSESFLREMVNSKLVKVLNESLSNTPMETIDALRVVDLCNVLAGYYPDKFSKGATIVTDKTGTLTTLKMQMLGCWTPRMSANVQLAHHAINVDELSAQERHLSFEVFAGAYTNCKDELEPEEASILKHYQSLLNDRSCLQVETIAKDHFKKSLTIAHVAKDLESWHLGLFRQFGGRLSLVADNGAYFLVYCGIPKADAFSQASLLNSYTTMISRTGVLSRDWAIARAELSEELFQQLKTLFSEGKIDELAQLVLQQCLLKLTHVCTFLIDNPVKLGAEHFIQHCKNISVPVLVATGDTAKAAENIAKVLCANSIEHIHIVKASMQEIAYQRLFDTDLSADTVIFVGITDAIKQAVSKLMSLPDASRPAIIFAEMSTEDKGVLAKHLKSRGYFVVANGDGTNDIAMMRVADFVIAHLNDSDTYAPGVGQYANLSDKQLAKLQHSQQSFYQLFDIHLKERSSFIQPFIRLANAQEMVSYALSFKAIKISFELAKTFAHADVNEVWQQLPLSIAFDLIWLWLSFREIDANADMPTNNEHLGRSSLPLQCMLATLGLAVIEAFVCYEMLGQTTDISLMVLMLAFLPTFLKSFFSGYADSQPLPLQQPRSALSNSIPVPLAEDINRLFSINRSLSDQYLSAHDTPLAREDFCLPK